MSRQAAEGATRVQKAHFLLRLDEIFESKELKEARDQFLHKYEELDKEIGESLKTKTVDQKNLELKKRFSDWMYETRDTNTQLYLKFLMLCGFFETVGLLCKRGHVDLSEVLDLYAPAIMKLSDATEAHITLRREREPSLNPIWMENYTFLVGKTREYIEARKKR